MAEFDLGTAQGKIVIDSSGARKGVDEANKSLDSIDEHSKHAHASLLLVSAGLAAIGAVGVVTFTAAVKHAADFEQTLSGVKAVTGATTDQMEAMRKKALKLGADTVFSAGDAAGAMEALAKAGLSVDDILNGAADATVALAAAGGIDLANAATIASNAMNQFGLSAAEMPHVADLIAGAANASAIDVNDFGLSLAQAGATANLIGLSFDDLSVAIAAMGNAGIRGSDAGTSLKTFMQNLQPVTQKQIDLFYDLGLTIDENSTALNPMGNAFFDASGKIKSMADIAGILQGSLAGMSDAQKTATLETIFGTDAIRAAATIANTGADGFNTLAGSMGKMTAADVAAVRMDNFKGSVEQLKGSIDTFLITIGTFLLPYLRDIADHATTIVNKFSDLDAGTQEVLAKIGLLVTAVATLAGGFGLISTALGPAGGAIASFGSAIGGLASSLVSALGPWGLLIAAVIALAAGIIYAYTHSEKFRKIIDGIIDSIVEFGKAVVKWFVDNILPALKTFAAFFETDILPRIRAFVKGAIEVIGNIATWITGTAVPAITGAWDKIVELAVAAWQWFDKNVISTIQAFVELAIAIFDRIREFFDAVLLPAIQRAMDILVPIIEFAFRTIATIITSVLDIIMGVINFFINAVQKFWALFGDNIIKTVELAFGFIKTTIETILGIIRGIVQVVTGLISGDWDKVMQGIRTITDSVWNSIKFVIDNVMGVIRLIIETQLDAIKFIIDTVWNAIKLVIDTIVGGIASSLSILWDGIKTSLQTVWNVIKGIAETVWNTIKLAITQPMSAIIGILQGVWDDVWGAASKSWDTIKSTISGAIDSVVGFVKALPDRLLDIGKDLLAAGKTIGGKLIDGLVEGLKAVGGFAGDVASGIVNAVKSAWNTFADKINGLIPNSLGWGPFAIPLPDDPIPHLFARGGLVMRETLGILAEKGPEAVIPLTDAARALQLMNASGLTQLVVNSLSIPAARSTPAPTSGTGEVIHIDHASFFDSVDVSMLLTQAEFAVQGGRF